MGKKNIIKILKTDIQIGDKPTAGRTTPVPTDALKPTIEVKPADKEKDSK